MLSLSSILEKLQAGRIYHLRTTDQSMSLGKAHLVKEIHRLSETMSPDQILRMIVYYDDDLNLINLADS